MRISDWSSDVCSSDLKTGAGYYDYDDARKPSPSQVTFDVIAGLSSVPPGSARIDDETILKRLLHPMINDSAKILDEGIAFRASDLDMVWVTGSGSPAHRGGARKSVASSKRVSVRVTLHGTRRHKPNNTHTTHR